MNYENMSQSVLASICESQSAIIKKHNEQVEKDLACFAKTTIELLNKIDELKCEISETKANFIIVEKLYEKSSASLQVKNSEFIDMKAERDRWIKKSALALSELRGVKVEFNKLKEQNQKIIYICSKDLYIPPNIK